MGAKLLRLSLCANLPNSDYNEMSMIMISIVSKIVVVFFSVAIYVNCYVLYKRFTEVACMAYEPRSVCNAGSS
jgi:hypothetical protein